MAPMVQLSQGYSATMRRLFTFNRSVPKSSWYSLDRSQKDERLNLYIFLPTMFFSRPKMTDASILVENIYDHRILQFGWLTTEK